MRAQQAGSAPRTAGSARGPVREAPDPALVAAARETIARGSGSFAAAARLFAPPERADAMLLYWWCRHCDDEVDGQCLGAPARPGAVRPADGASRRVAALREATLAALAGAPPVSPPFAALASVAHRRGFDPALPLEHLAGFEMDADGTTYTTLDALLVYCARVAGVVGEMVASVMGARGAALAARACDLGIAFQLTNIARDVVDDARIGRVYLPADWLREAGLPGSPDALADPAARAALVGPVHRLLDAAEPFYASARIGVSALPPRSAWAVGTALATYRAIGTAVRARGARAWDRRVSTSTARKLACATGALPRALRTAVVPAAPGRVADRGGLWSRG